MEYQEYSARTVEEAITKACLELAVTSDRLDYEVVGEGSSGFFGIGKKDAVIKAKIKEDKKETKKDQDKKNNRPEKKKIKTLDEIDAKAKASSSAGAGNKNKDKKDGGRDRDNKNRDRKDRDNKVKEPKEEPVKRSQPKPEKAVPVRSEEEIAKMKEDARVFLTDVFEKMGLTVEQEYEYDKETGYLTGVFSGEEMGIIIGKRGQTLDSLQYLTSLVVNKNQKEYVRIKLDTEEYRKRRKETLENLSKNIAYKVKKNRRPVVLEPMNPYERRIIHSALQGNKSVYTYSEGEEPYRRVVVAYNKKNK